MKKTLSVITTVALAAALLASCGGKDENKDSAKQTESALETQIATESSEAPETDVETEAVEGTFEIPFAGLVLKYPEKWKDAVTTEEGDDGSLVFSTNGAPLFTLFANGDHIVLGTVKGEKYTVLSLDFAQIDDGDESAAAMQEDINVIISHLSEDYDFAMGAVLEQEDDTTFAIETGVTTFYYPAKWQDRVKVDVSDAQVSFSADGVALFELVFSETDDGYPIGTYDGTPIYVVDHPVEGDEYAEMQDAMNVILQHLLEDEKFVVAS